LNAKHTNPPNWLAFNSNYIIELIYQLIRINQQNFGITHLYLFLSGWYAALLICNKPYKGGEADGATQ
jgi:hypothetical protein